AIEAAETINATVVNMRFVKPIDGRLVNDIAASHDFIVTLEENVIAGGAGSAVNEYLSANQLATPTLNLGLPDRYIDQASQQQQLASCGLGTDGIIKSITSSSFYRAGFNIQDSLEKKPTLA
ncbi:MAG: 1-deoxy-D-xylulose-5-phosphate synthase, partial [Arenicella sp.]